MYSEPAVGRPPKGSGKGALQGQVVSKDRWSPRTGGLQGQVVSKDRWSLRIGAL